ncbi:MAG: hypothetical protein HYY40_11900 [Bacteroidetes bacterium]|nr:hypothetical protein [Bacteroidota bacterium]
MNNLKIGLVIGTYSAVPYIHLHLESRKRNYPEIPILVHDDCSHNKQKLIELCKEYGADFVSTTQRSVPTLGDISAFVRGLEWANKQGFDVLVKMSRRFVPKSGWTAELINLVQTGHHTFSNVTRSFNFGFRTECIGMKVKDWLQDIAINNLTKTLNNNVEVFVEGHIHNIARELNKLNKKAQSWDIVNNRPPEANAFAIWSFMGDDRCVQYPGFLWHDSHLPGDYYDLANQWNFTYAVEDFNDPNEGDSNGR